MNESTRIFASAVSKSDLPPEVRRVAWTAQGVESYCLDPSYIAFLDEQIALNARGDGWTARLKQRREKLLPYCDRMLIHGRIVFDNEEWSLDVDPGSTEVVHCESYGPGCSANA